MKNYLNFENDIKDLESELEKDSRFSVPTKEKEDENILRIQRQHIRIYIFYGIIIFLIIFILKSFMDDLTILNTSGLNFFNMCNIPDN